ncbi:hypothetical protein [Streptomyces sp. NPDC102360]|uniref:hypothetical protein n=1 Tax=Streptomyces sp. NPDC102360 TaxID=3366160 RepID=UPI00381B4DB5
MHGELATLGITIAASPVREILTSQSIAPAPDRAATTWADFLRSQAGTLLACDFIETVPLTGQRQYVLAVIQIHGTTAHPTAEWVTQAARNLAIHLTDAQATHAYLIRDRDAKYPALFDQILANTGKRMPRMNAVMGHWVQTCRHELLDRTLIWNKHHLRHTLRQFEPHHKSTGPTQRWNRQRRYALSLNRSPTHRSTTSTYAEETA